MRVRRKRYSTEEVSDDGFGGAREESVHGDRRQVPVVGADGSECVCAESCDVADGAEDCQCVQY